MDKRNDIIYSAGQKNKVTTKQKKFYFCQSKYKTLILSNDEFVFYVLYQALAPCRGCSRKKFFITDNL